uniref:Pre-mRNA-splicing regulator WTAP n=1 Tax=Esox lucius TaxID=8010 RepID=A0AAY5L1G8_ESOLU
MFQTQIVCSRYKPVRMTEEPVPKKVRLSESDLKTLTREELCERYCYRWKQEEAYVQMLETKYADLNSNDVTGLRESEEKLKLQQQEAARRENILVMRLATKEQEMQECTTQIQYLKQAQQPSVAQLRSTLVDPAVNLFFLKMKSELEENKDKLEQAQNELSAWKFTPDSQTGKKLMAKCRMLIQENQELGRQISQGRIAQLEAELALQKKYSEELKSSQDELNDFIIQLDEEVEGMQSTILVLQQQLRETRQQLNQREGSVPLSAPTSAPLDHQPEPEENDRKMGLVKANGPGNTSPSNVTETDSGPSPSTHVETCVNTEQDQESLLSPSNTGTDSKLSSHSRTITQQLSQGYYETVDSPAGSETSVTLHSIDWNQDPQEVRTVTRTRSGTDCRTAGALHTQNGLNVTM